MAKHDGGFVVGVFPSEIRSEAMAEISRLAYVEQQIVFADELVDAGGGGKRWKNGFEFFGGHIAKFGESDSVGSVQRKRFNTEGTEEKRTRRFTRGRASN